MVWKYLKRWMGVADDRSVDDLTRKIEKLEERTETILTQHVLTISDRLDSLEDSLAEQRETSESNEEALAHLIDVVSHQLEADVADADPVANTLHERLEYLEHRLQAFEGAVESAVPGYERKLDASRRPSRRVELENGRPTSTVETAAGLKEGKMLWDTATSAQKSILKVMYDLGYPVSYREIADEVGRSLSTVKNHINNLKASGFDFKEDVGYNNAKKYMLDDRVKTFITLRLND